MAEVSAHRPGGIEWRYRPIDRPSLKEYWNYPDADSSKPNGRRRVEFDRELTRFEPDLDLKTIHRSREITPYFIATSAIEGGSIRKRESGSALRGCQQRMFVKRWLSS
jgi:hypothetical protein